MLSAVVRHSGHVSLQWARIGWLTHTALLRWLHNVYLVCISNEYSTCITCLELKNTDSRRFNGKSFLGELKKWEVLSHVTSHTICVSIVFTTGLRVHFEEPVWPNEYRQIDHRKEMKAHAEMILATKAHLMLLELQSSRIDWARPFQSRFDDWRCAPTRYAMAIRAMTMCHEICVTLLAKL